jgi:hypothetical protein
VAAVNRSSGGASDCACKAVKVGTARHTASKIEVNDVLRTVDLLYGKHCTVNAMNAARERARFSPTGPAECELSRVCGFFPVAYQEPEQ